MRSQSEDSRGELCQASEKWVKGQDRGPSHTPPHPPPPPPLPGQLLLLWHLLKKPFPTGADVPDPGQGTEGKSPPMLARDTREDRSAVKPKSDHDFLAQNAVWFLFHLSKVSSPSLQSPGTWRAMLQSDLGVIPDLWAHVLTLLPSHMALLADLQHTKLSATSGPLHVPCPQISMWLPLLLPSGRGLFKCLPLQEVSPDFPN